MKAYFQVEFLKNLKNSICECICYETCICGTHTQAVTSGPRIFFIINACFM